MISVFFVFASLPHLKKQGLCINRTTLDKKKVALWFLLEITQSHAVLVNLLLRDNDV